MTRRRKHSGVIQIPGSVSRSEGVVAHTDDIVARTDDLIHRAELNSIAAQAVAQQKADAAEARATAAVAATDH